MKPSNSLKKVLKVAQVSILVKEVEYNNGREDKCNWRITTGNDRKNFVWLAWLRGPA